MLIIENPKHKQYTSYSSDELRNFQNRYSVEKTGRAFLRSIVEVDSEHFYKGWWYLVFRLKMCDKIRDVALRVNQKMGFSSGSSDNRLDPVFWQRQREGNFSCKTKDFAKAVNALLVDKSINRLECRGLSEVMALRSMQLALGNTRFNKLLGKVLGSKPLTLILDMFGPLLEWETLKVDPGNIEEKGDDVFRPGDIVAFSNSERKKADGTQWRVENAVCVGWKDDASGNPDLSEPLFVGGGVANVFTEAEMKEYIYQKTPDSRVTGDRKGHFAEKAIGGPECTHLLDSDAEKKSLSLKGTVPNIFLNENVNRIPILGGRRDL